MDLFDRYLAAVKLFLPRAQQEDIIRELSEDIHSQMEDKEAALGRPLTHAEQKELIKQFGHPALLAGRYGPRRQLIGPEIFPFYWLVLKLSLGANLLAQIIAFALTLAAGRSIRPDLRIFSTVAALFICFGIVTIVFAALDRYRPSTLGRRSWDPDRLPAMKTPPRRGSHPVTRIVWGVLFMVWWAAATPYPALVLGPGAEALAFGPGWHAMHPWILVLALISVVTAFFELLQPNWIRLRSAARLIGCAGSLVVVFILLRAGNFVVPAAATASSALPDKLVQIVNQSIVWTFLFVALTSLLVGVRELRFWMQSGRRRPQLPVASLIALLLTLTVSSGRARAQNQVGGLADAAALYAQRCASCHDAGVQRAPGRSALAQMSPENIRLALSSGSMRGQASGLDQTDIETLSRFLADSRQSRISSGEACHPDAAPFEPSAAQPKWNGWGVDESQRRFQPAEMARLTSDQISRLTLKWAFGFPGVAQANAQPAVVGGRLFVGSMARKVYSLSAATGCLYWSFDTEFPVRTAMTVGVVGQTSAVYFGDQHANVYAVDAVSGSLLWKRRIDEHMAAMITGAPTLAAGKLYVPVSSAEEVWGADPKYSCCKFRGSVSALDPSTGQLFWKTYTIPEEPQPVRKNKTGVQLWGPSGAAVWSSPTVDLERHRVYVTTGDSYSDPPATTSDAFVALDSDTGRLLWSRQMTAGDAFTIDCDFPEAFRTNCAQANGPDFDFGSPPMLVRLPDGHRALIAGQKSGVVHAIDPDRDGAVLWQRRVGRGGRMGGVQWGSAADGGNAYVAIADIKVTPVPAGTPGGHKSMMGTLALDPKAGGGLMALTLATGDTVWNTPHPGCGDTPGCSPGQSAAITAIPGVIFFGGLDGHMRAYSAADGQILWDMDTNREYATINGVTAHGGSIDGPGAVVVAGMLYVTSGYAYLGSAPGNVLLAFSVDRESR